MGQKFNKEIILQEPVAFSQSHLWEMLQKHFDEEGVEAWKTTQLPFYTTSNPFIAACYATIAYAFIKDKVKQNPEARNYPFYFLELGAGLGQFAYHFVKSLLKQIKDGPLADIQFCYVMSDITEKNTTFYEDHPAFVSYLQQGFVDFAVYNAEKNNPIKLIKKNINLNHEVLFNPLIVFANYFFDSLRNDLFCMQKNKLSLLLASLSTEPKNMKNDKVLELEKIKIKYTPQETEENYYKNSDWNQLLSHYKRDLQDGVFSIPTMALQVMQSLTELTQNKLFFIATDSGFCSIDSLRNIGYPHLAFYTKFFAMAVNFHAISEYVKNVGGDAFLQDSHCGVKTNVFCSERLADLVETSKALEESLRGFSPLDYYNLIMGLREKTQKYNADSIAAWLALSKWDPNVFLVLIERIIFLVENRINSEFTRFLKENLPKIADNYYYVPDAHCVLYEIAFVYSLLESYDVALTYYEKSVPFMKENYNLCYNMGHCQRLLGDEKGALESMRRALAFNQKSASAKKWVSHLEEKLKNEH